MRYTQVHLKQAERETKVPHVIAYDKLLYRFVLIPKKLYEQALYKYDTQRTIYGK